jgi:hypothetical protein
MKQIGKLQEAKNFRLLVMGSFFIAFGLVTIWKGIKKLGAEMEIPARFKSNIL